MTAVVVVVDTEAVEVESVEVTTTVEAELSPVGRTGTAAGTVVVIVV